MHRVDWKKGIDLNSLKRVWYELGAAYPFKLNKLKYFNSGTAWKLAVSMVKPFLPKELTVEFGCQFETRLDSLYLVPSLQEANRRLVGRVEETLGRRYEHERTFRL
jgi:hypothetical protein